MNTITVTGGNLFAVAALTLNDATQWWRIAAANGIDDPMLSGLVTLIIPSVNAALAGGIPIAVQ